MKKANYSVAMWLMYQTSRLILNNCLAKLTDFAKFSASYTAAMIAALRKEVDDAELLPSEEARALVHESLREEVLPLWKTGTNMWQLLKRHIAKGFAKEFWEMNWNSAGWQYYDTNMNFGKAESMFTMALEYISVNEAALLANDNMPATFKQDFTDAVALFAAKYAAFLAAEIAAEEGTDEKIDANNTVYAKIIMICEDGQALYVHDETKKGELSFEKMSELIRPIGPAGMKGNVTKNGVPQAGIIVELENKNLSVITDAEGAFDFGNKLASGTDKLVLKQGDEILLAEDVVLPPGVTKTEQVELPATPPVA